MAPKMKMLRPTDDKVLVVLTPKEDMSDGGIVLPSCYDDDAQYTATVIAVGPGRLLQNGQRVAPCCKEGDKVLLMAEGMRVEVDGRKLNLVDAQHVLAVIEES